MGQREEPPELMKRSKAIDWLLAEDQPSIRYLTLTQILGRGEDDPEVESAKAGIAKRGWAADILGKQKAGGYWEDKADLYRPKYLSTNWMLLVLSDLGVTKEDPRIERAANLWIEQLSTADGGFAPSGGKHGHLCTVGNTARGLVNFGYADHPKVRSAFEWLVTNQDKNGGWSCFGADAILIRGKG